MRRTHRLGRGREFPHLISVALVPFREPGLYAPGVAEGIDVMLPDAVPYPRAVRLSPMNSASASAYRSNGVQG